MNRLLGLVREKDAQALPMVAAALTVVLGMAAFVIDRRSRAVYVPRVTGDR